VIAVGRVGVKPCDHHGVLEGQTMAAYQEIEWTEGAPAAMDKLEQLAPEVQSSGMFIWKMNRAGSQNTQVELRIGRHES